MLKSVSMKDRSLIKVVGENGYKRLREMRVLLVGAGGIGCELLKDLILMGYGEIHVVDLDTIDLSNLNRQFLFRQKDIKKPKASTAVNAVSYFSNSCLVAHQGNIMDACQFPLSWFRQFTVIFNALDNVAARRHMNKVSQFLNLPLLESGTEGFNGYIQPIIPGKTECFDCTTKETPKTYPVCTIRSTPSTLVHCVVWAKDFLFQQLYGVVAAEGFTETELGTDNQEEIERIRENTNELQQLHDWIRGHDEDASPRIIKKLFVEDIKKLLQISTLWKTRAKPVPLPSFQLGTKVVSTDLNEVWSLQNNIEKFAESIGLLRKRLVIEPTIDFDKDDPAALLFVATAANIRAHVFHIPTKSVFDIKQIAGNIIPAIVTTNAIIAGLSSTVSLRVLNLMRLFENDPENIPMAFTSKASNVSTNRYLSAPTLSPPNPKCAVCSYYQRAVLQINDTTLCTLTLGELIEAIKKKYGFSEDMSVMDTTTGRLLADFDFDNLTGNTLENLKLVQGSILAFTDEYSSETDNTVRKPLEVYLEVTQSVAGLSLPEVPLLRVVKENTEENDAEDLPTRETDTGESNGQMPVTEEGAILIYDDDDFDAVGNANPHGLKRSADVGDGLITKRNKKENSPGTYLVLD